MNEHSYPWKERTKIVFIVWLYRFYYLFLRVTKEEKPLILSQRKEQEQAVLYAHFHGDEVALLRLFANQNLTILTSLSRDGEFLSRILWRLGYHTVRGSSSKGGMQALRRLAHIVKKGGDVGIAVDGPRGPAYEVKQGILMLAKLTQAPIIPIAVNPRSCRQLQNTWDQTQIPLPFTTVKLHYGAPIFVPRDSKEGQMEMFRLQLQEQLTALKKLPSL